MLGGLRGLAGGSNYPHVNKRSEEDEDEDEDEEETA